VRQSHVRNCRSYCSDPGWHQGGGKHVDKKSCFRLPPLGTPGWRRRQPLSQHLTSILDPAFKVVSKDGTSGQNASPALAALTFWTQHRRSWQAVSIRGKAAVVAVGTTEQGEPPGCSRMRSRWRPSSSPTRPPSAAIGQLRRAPTRGGFPADGRQARRTAGLARRTRRTENTTTRSARRYSDRHRRSRRTYS
jgi:hypothetical protein